MVTIVHDPTEANLSTGQRVTHVPLHRDAFGEGGPEVLNIADEVSCADSMLGVA
jgi:hypothetical protein